MNKETALNLYIIENVLCDYTSGMAVIVAENLTRCRELYKEEFGSASEYDNAIEAGSYKVLSVIGQNEGVVSYSYGGG